MRKKITFIFFLILFFNPQHLVKANDIKEFEIEGISIGDSLLLYETKQNIEANSLNDYKSSDKYSRFNLTSVPFDIYDYVQVHFRTNDKNYIIVSVSGGIEFKNEFDACLKKRDEVIKDLSVILPDAETKDYPASPWLEFDSSGETFTAQFGFWFENNDIIEVACYDWSEKINTERNFVDHLKVNASTGKFNEWLNNEAYK